MEAVFLSKVRADEASPGNAYNRKKKSTDVRNSVICIVDCTAARQHGVHVAVLNTEHSFAVRVWQRV